MRPVTFKQAMALAHRGLESPGLPVPAAATSNLNQSSDGEGTYLEASGGSRAIARGAVCVSRKRAAAAARKEAGRRSDADGARLQASHGEEDAGRGQGS